MGMTALSTVDEAAANPRAFVLGTVMDDIVGGCFQEELVCMRESRSFTRRGDEFSNFESTELGGNTLEHVPQGNNEESSLHSRTTACCRG